MSCPIDPVSSGQRDQTVACDPQPDSGDGTVGQKNLSTQPTNEAIPQPPTHWFTDNLSEIDPDFPLASTLRLAELYGPIFQLDLVRSKTVFISSYELINDVCDESRFEKTIDGPLSEVRRFLGDGLFTAYNSEMNWWTAHKILMPAFGPLKIRQMFPEVMDISSQIILKWDHLGPDHDINISDDFTRLAFDTISFCAFSHRFNSFYSAKPHEFAQQMPDVLIYCGQRGSRTTAENYLRIFSAEDAQQKIKAMWDVCDHLVSDRKQHPQPESKDLLNTMLFASDPNTGEKLSEENIRFNMATFLVAGHETSSGTLSFLWNNLLHNPETYHKAQAEVDQVVGDAALDIKHLPQLKYLQACLRETLRFQGPIGRFGLQAKEDTYLANRYFLKKGTNIAVNVKGLHHDPMIWGADHDEFRPERMLDGGYESLPPNAFNAFGNGRRACIGRTFAEQEMMIVAALILQRFQIEMSDPTYELKMMSTLTVKPDGLFLRARRRPGKGVMVGLPGASATGSQAGKSTGHEDKIDMPVKPLGDKDDAIILYGSNSGTCKSIAEDLQSELNSNDLRAIVEIMDKATENLSKDVPVIIITPSYEGRPADNARNFVAWLESGQATEAIKGLSYAVFGVGNSEWASTFHKVPKLVDNLVGKMGAQSLVATGLCDVKEDLVGPWDAWKDEALKVLSQGHYAVSKQSLSVTVETPSAARALGGKDLSEATVIANTELADTTVGPAKRHLEIEMPEGATYRTGDYIVVQPVNPKSSIQRALILFKLHADDVVRISGTTKAFLTENMPISAMGLIGARLELSTPVSQRRLQLIAATNTDKLERQELERLAANDTRFKAEVLAKRISILDILEDYPHCNVSFDTFLDCMKPLSPRQYSISTSPLASGSETNAEANEKLIASITYDVHLAPALSGHNRTFQGVASNFLASRPVSGKIRCSIRSTNAAFHTPADLETPVIMICAGSGIAPMRGFCQERACIKKANPDRKLGKAILYFGCRSHDNDFIYANELREWDKLGAVDLRPVFSRSGPNHEMYRHVPERIWAEREEVADLFKDGAKILLCGSAGKLGKRTSEVCKKIWLERFPDETEEEAEEWLQGIKEDRYVSDVFD